MYYDSEFIQNDRDKKYITTFERLCKVALSTIDKECLRKSNEQDRMDNRFKGSVYGEDCPCRYDSCIEVDLRHKSLKLLEQYPCIPTKSIWNVRHLSWNDCITIHRKLVDEYNLIVKSYIEYTGKSKIDISNKKYKAINYMY